MQNSHTYRKQQDSKLYPTTSFHIQSAFHFLPQRTFEPRPKCPRLGGGQISSLFLAPANLFLSVSCVLELVWQSLWDRFGLNCGKFDSVLLQFLQEFSVVVIHVSIDGSKATSTMHSWAGWPCGSIELRMSQSVSSAQCVSTKLQISTPSDHSVFKPLQRTTFFTKLNLNNAYKHMKKRMSGRQL